MSRLEAHRGPALPEWKAIKQNLDDSLVRLEFCQFHLNICDNEELRVRCNLMLLDLLNCGKLFRAVGKTYTALIFYSAHTVRCLITLSSSQISHKFCSSKQLFFLIYYFRIKAYACLVILVHIVLHILTWGCRYV